MRPPATRTRATVRRVWAGPGADREDENPPAHKFPNSSAVLLRVTIEQAVTEVHGPGPLDRRYAMPSVVMLLRHAEKPLGEGPPYGVTIDGALDSESLTPRGWQRAGALVGLFVPDQFGRAPNLPTPAHLFASQIGGSGSSQRPRETLLPLSERLGLAVDSSFPKEAVDELVRAVRTSDGVVLIAWEHHLMPSVANLLTTDTSKVPQTWPDDRYDLIWVFDITARPGGSPGFREVPQMLLAGDKSTPIGKGGPA
jgi:hypothetical protein